MFQRWYSQFLKGQKLLALTGLVIILLIIRNKKMIKHKADQFNQSIILQSNYSKYLDFILAQAKHESANFTSPVYKANNNAFGMKVPSQRKFLGTKGTKASDGGYYARYDSDSTSYKDFILWLEARRFPKDLRTVQEYASALKDKGYFTDSLENYTKALQRWIKK